MEQADGVGAAADARNQAVGQTAFLRLHLFAHLIADDELEIAHHGGIGVRAGGRADQVIGARDARDPVAQRLVHGVLQRARARRHRAHFGAQHLHA